MKAIIIGAGMGGMSAALALEQAGYATEVYEAVTEIRPVGAAISLWPNGIKCLNTLGLHDAIARLGGNMAAMAYLDGHDATPLTQFSLAPLVTAVGEAPYPVARAELQRLLLSAYGRDRVHFGKRICRVEQDDDGVTAHFEDGSQAHGDLLVAADGTHSVVRPYVLDRTVTRRYAGYVNWNSLVAADDNIAPLDQWTTFVAEGKRVSLMPIAGHRFYVFFDVPLPQGLAEDRTSLKCDLARYFKGWAHPVQQLIDRLDPESTNRIEIHDIEPFERLVKGRVALLGDAGHSTTPDIGQGGCAAMEDAIVLAQTLRTHSLGIEDALLRYEARRIDRVRDLVLKARRRCDVTHGVDPAETQAWYDALRHETGTHIIEGLRATIVGGPLG